VTFPSCACKHVAGPTIRRETTKAAYSETMRPPVGVRVRLGIDSKPQGRPSAYARARYRR